MLFVNLSLLAGTALVALPIVLHLVMRQKPKLLEFPALRFIQQRHDTNRRQLRLRHLLLLALRALLIAVLAFALARPSIPVSSGGILGGGKEPVAAAIVLDSSLRMEYKHENKTRLDVARELSDWLLSQLPPESEVAVLDSRLGPASFQVDLGAAKHRIERLELTNNAQPLPAVMEEAIRLLGTSELARKEVYVFTDLARVAWPSDAAGRLQEKFAAMPELGVYVVDVGVEAPKNVALGDLRLSRQTLSARSTLQVSADVTSTGAGGDRTIELYLLEPDGEKSAVGGRKPVKAGEQTVSLEPDQPQQIQFRKAGLGLGTHQGYLQILGSDGLPADDRRYFTIEVTPPWKLLVVAPQPAEQYAAYLTEVLSPASFRRTGRARFECTTIAQGQLAAHDLEPYAAVFLLDPKPVEPGVWQKLGDYAAGGRGVAVFLGRNAQPIEAFNQGPAQELLGGKLMLQGTAPEGLRLAPANLEHPVLSEFRGRAGAVPWFLHPVYRYWLLNELPQDANVVAPYNNNEPAIVERPVGKGRVLTVTTPISDNPNRDPWNLLPMGLGEPWVFVILAHEMASYLAGSTGQELNYLAEQTAVLQLDRRQEQFRSFVLTEPDGEITRLTPDQKRHALAIASTDQPGNYRVQAGGTAEGVDRGFSVNAAAEQTRLDRVSQDELAQIFGPIPHRLAKSKDEIELSVSTGRVGRELFPLLILAVAVLLGIEQLVSNRFYREAK